MCCYFIANCGRSYSQNLTYWTKTTTTPCTINVCKCQSEVCFLRLDFNSFNIYQPNTDLTVTNPTIASQCDQDVLTISSPGWLPVKPSCNASDWSTTGAIPVPRLCGVNNGYHLYVEMPGDDDSCAELSLTQASDYYLTEI